MTIKMTTSLLKVKVHGYSLHSGKPVVSVQFTPGTHSYICLIYMGRMQVHIFKQCIAQFDYQLYNPVPFLLLYNFMNTWTIVYNIHIYIGDSL